MWQGARVGFVLLCLAPWPVAVRGADPQLPKDVEAAVKRALELTNVTFHALGERPDPATKMAKVEEAGRQFTQALDQLAALLDEQRVRQLAGRDIETRLLAL